MLSSAPLLLLSAAALAPRSAQVVPPQGPPDQAPQPLVLGADVTFLANEGFLIESGRYSVLIDAFVREQEGIYGALPTEVHKELVNARPPFDGLTIVLVSHEHADHVQMRSLEKYLGNNSQAQLMTSPRVIEALRGGSRDFQAIQRRVTPIPTVRGSPNKLVQEEMSLEFFQLEHGGKANEGGFNLAHLIEIGGVRLLHVGDAEPTPANFSPYKLASRNIDVAFVPYWFFGSPAGMQVLQEEIRARTVVACHVPPREWERLDQLLKEQFPEVVLFKEALEKRSFLPAGTAPPPGTSEGGG